jgi:Spy/CpxP family protein refolding chaperone
MTHGDSACRPTDQELPAPSKKGRLKAVALGIVILLCGALLGSGITLVAVKRMMNVIHTPGEVAKRITERMQRKLDLSPEQHRRVLAILRAREKSLRTLLGRIQPQIEKELWKTREEVAAVLNPEQAQKWLNRFDVIHERWKKRWFSNGRKQETAP